MYFSRRRWPSMAMVIFFIMWPKCKWKSPISEIPTIFVPHKGWMRILIVDDEKSIKNTLKEILNYENHASSTCRKRRTEGTLGPGTGKGQIDTVFAILKCRAWTALKCWKKYRKWIWMRRLSWSRSRQYWYGGGVHQERGLRFHWKTSGFEPYPDHSQKCQR